MMDTIKESSVEPKIHDVNGAQSEDTLEASDVKDAPRPKEPIAKAEGSGDEEVSCILPLF
jgi:hypothetical protein